MWFVVLASLLLLLVSLSWAALTPGFRAPDEVQHLNSVVRLAEGDGWPKPGDAFVREEVIDARELSGSTQDGKRTYLPGSVNGGPDSLRFAEVPPTGVAERESLDGLDDEPTDTRSIDQMTQHPPGYYALAAVVYDAAQVGEWRYDRALFLLRALGALMIAVTVPVSCFVAARELTGLEWAGRLAAFAPLLVPQLGFVGGSVTNDAAAIAVAAVLWAALLKVLCSGPSRRRLLVLGLAVAAALWTKGTALSLIPGAFLAIPLAYRRSRGGALRDWGRPAAVSTGLVMAGAFVLGGWWWALNIVRFGSLQPAAYYTPQGAMSPLGIFEFAEIFARRIRQSFFGDIGLLEAPMPDWFTLSLLWVFLVLCGVGLLSRRRLGARLIILLGLGLTVGILFTTTYSAHLHTLNLPGLQGRYLFVLIVPLAALLAAGLVRIGRVARLSGVWLGGGVAAVGLVVALLGLGFGFRIYYVEPGRSWGDAVDLFLGWSPWSPIVIAGLLSSLVLCALALALLLGRVSALHELGSVGQPVPAPYSTDRRPLSGTDEREASAGAEPASVPAGGLRHQQN